MKASTENKVLNYIELSSALLKRALDEVQVHRGAQKKATDLRSAVLQRLTEVGCVQEGEKQAAEAMLSSHAETLGLLKSAVDKIAELKGKIQKQAGELGRGEDQGKAGTPGEKTASDGFDSVNDGYVGRKTSKRKASDEAILKVLNS